MEGDFDQFEEIDDDLLSALPLDDINSNYNAVDKISSVKEDLPVILPEFAFPFEPYDIQVGFMQNLYKALELGKIGIFESPTGTGKSLSVICGALRWLKDHVEKQRQQLEEMMKFKADPVLEELKQESKQELDWIQEFAIKQEIGMKTKKLQEEEDARKKRDIRLKAVRSRHPVQKRKRDGLEEQFDELFKDAPSTLKEQLTSELDETLNDNTQGDEDLILEEYVSDEEVKRDDDSDDDDEDHITKIYFCSRTHSQLSQFVREIQKSPYGKDTPVISLGSRQNLCINESVRKLKSLSLMNDRCLEMQKNKDKKPKGGEAKRKKSSGGCPFYKQDPMMDFRDAALAEIGDIEQLVTKAKQIKACPYYGTRYALKMAELVALPYNTLLHSSTRKSCGIKLKDNVVIIDEAHNLMETITNIHSVEITGAQLSCAYSQLSQYQDRYRSRLKAKNLMYIRQLLFLLSTFIRALGGKTGIPAEQQKLLKSGTRLQTINDFLFDCHMDNFNLFKVLHYCEKSMIARKLHGFVEKYQPQVRLPDDKIQEQKTPIGALSKFLKDISQPNMTKADIIQEQGREPDEQAASFTSPLIQILGFLEALTNANKDGRIVINKQEYMSRSSMKFLLLNPAVYFDSIIAEARAVIVTGGTMEPISEFKEQLFYAAGVSPERILHYSCGHVIGPNQLLPMAVRRGPSGLELDFTYHHRDTTDMMDELGRVIYNVCNVVVGGVVVFLPSYEYEKTVHDHWQRTGCLEKICAKKKLFREPKKSSQVDTLLTEYGSFIKKHVSSTYSSYTGAVIFCVVGGKMSEGINFSDDLGRCVLMVGLPYPNIKSPELKEKMDYLNANMPKSQDGRLPGQVHYENLCMKAVNQSIGRAIRHKGDYASILLLDHRYLRPGMKSKLPQWIVTSLNNVERFGPVFSNLRKFFADKLPASTS